MGMDLSAKNDGVEGFHANWSMWGLFGDLLSELGCDTSEMAGDNSGDVVSATAAAAWGQAILDNRGRILVDLVPDTLYEGGARWVVRSEGSGTPGGVSASEAALQAALAAGGLDTPAPAAGDIKTVPLSEMPELEEEVLKFAAFCIASGGFEQW